MKTVTGRTAQNIVGIIANLSNFKNIQSGKEIARHAQASVIFSAAGCKGLVLDTAGVGVKFAGTYSGRPVSGTVTLTGYEISWRYSYI